MFVLCYSYKCRMLKRIYRDGGIDKLSIKEFVSLLEPSTLIEMSAYLLGRKQLNVIKPPVPFYFATPTFFQAVKY